MQYVIQGKTGLKSVSLNRRKAIRESCLNCTGWSVREIAECQFSDCQLYPFRTGDGKQNPKARNSAIRQYCLCCMNGQRAEVAKCPSFDCSLFPYRGVRNGLQKSISVQKKAHIDATFG